MQINKDLPGFPSREAGIAFLIDRIKYNLRNIELERGLTLGDRKVAAANIVLLAKILVEALDLDKRK